MGLGTVRVTITCSGDFRSDPKGAQDFYILLSTHRMLMTASLRLNERLSDFLVYQSRRVNAQTRSDLTACWCWEIFPFSTSKQLWISEYRICFRNLISNRAQKIDVNIFFENQKRKSSSSTSLWSLDLNGNFLCWKRSCLLGREKSVCEFFWLDASPDCSPSRSALPDALLYCISRALNQ